MSTRGESESNSPTARNLQVIALERVAIWLVGELLLVGAVAWVAFQIQQEAIAPAVLFPILVGAALGAASAILVGRLQAPSARIAVAASVVAGLLVVVAQDYIGHRHRVRRLAEQISTQQPLAQVVAGNEFARPEFSEYLAGKVRGEPVWWSLDLVLTSAAAGATTAWMLARRNLGEPR